MRIEVTLKGYYDLSDDPTERIKLYGTADIQECLAIDRDNDPDLLLGICEDVTLTSFKVV